MSAVRLEGRLPSEVRFEVAPGLLAPRRARHRLLTWGGSRRGVDGDVLALLTSELVTNVVLHTRSAARVHLLVCARAVRVEVSDDDPVLPVRRPASDTAVTGRGLQIVERLADRWGVSPRHDDDGAIVGKTVWFELDRSSGAGGDPDDGGRAREVADAGAGTR